MIVREKLEGRTVCVTGAAGFVGSNLCRDLRGHGADVHAVVRPGTQPFRLADIADQLRVHRVELRDAAAVQSLLREVRPDVVFHSAVHNAYRRDDPLAALVADNVLATANLIDAIVEQGSRLIHLGSSTEYGPAVEPHRESGRLLPITQHGATKAAATVLVTQQSRSGRLDGATLRLFSVYGPWEPEHRLVPSAISAALNDTTLPLTAPGLRRDYVFVSDAVEACLLAACNENIRGHVINVGAGQETSNEEVVEEIAGIVGRAIATAPGTYPRHGTDTAHWAADIALAGELLGWRPRHSLREGLEKTVQWNRARFETRITAREAV